jgi:hypothetical protein
MQRVLTCLLLALTLHPCTSTAGASAPSVEELTQRLLSLHAESQQGVAARGALVSAAAAREQRLSELMADHPDVVLRHAMSASQRSALPADVQPHVEEEQQLEGVLEVLHEDGPDGSRYHYFLRRAAERLALYFASNGPVLQTGDQVRVLGVRVQQALALSSGTTQVALQSAALPNTFGVQRTIVILVNFQDKPTQTWLTTTQAHDVVFGTGFSVTNFFDEASYRQASLTGDVVGIYTIPVNSTACDYSAISSYADQAAQQHGADLGNYSRIIYSFPKNACSWSGLGTVGGNPGRAWINGAFINGIVAHEMGHNYGLYHSHAWDCGSARIGSSCTHIEYGDTFDAMGTVSLSNPPTHYNATQKELLGWLNYSTSPPITTVQSTGVYTLDPYESVGANPKALKVRLPSGDWYYVEYRQAIGFDAATVSGSANVRNGVVVHWWTQQNPDKIYLLDMTGGTSSWSDPALDVNQVFTDSGAGISMTTVWANGTAGVSVTVPGGGSSCVRNAPSVQVSPAQQQASAGGTLNYTVSVTNNDNGCAASDFLQSASAPSGWTVAFGLPTLTLAAGATASTTMQVQSVGSTVGGSYSVSVASTNASAPTYSGSSSAVYVVLASGTGGSVVDTFDRPNSTTLGSNWLTISGTLSVQSNEARSGIERKTHMAVFAALQGATQTISAAFASVNNNLGPRFGLVARYQDPQNYYACYRRAGAASNLSIVRVVNGAETILAKASIPNPAKNAWFTLGCEVQDTTLTLSLNGATKATVSDPTFASGRVGLFMGYPTASGTGYSQRANNFSATVQ